MSSINAAQLGITQSPKIPSSLTGLPAQSDDQLTNAKNIKKAFTQFVGETFYGTMLKSMRKTTSEPAYFHGGQAEEMFQGQLDQQIASDMASSGSSGMADSLFKNQFPKEAMLIDRYEANRQDPMPNLAELNQLRSR